MGKAFRYVHGSGMGVKTSADKWTDPTERKMTWVYFEIVNAKVIHC